MEKKYNQGDNQNKATPMQSKWLTAIRKLRSHGATGPDFVIYPLRFFFAANARVRPHLGPKGIDFLFF